MTTALEHAIRGMIHVYQSLKDEAQEIRDNSTGKEHDNADVEYRQYKCFLDTLSSFKGFLSERGIDQFYHRSQVHIKQGKQVTRRLAKELYAYMWLEPSATLADFKAAAGYATCTETASSFVSTSDKVRQHELQVFEESVYGEFRV
jgi:hypothetical protein